MKTLAIGLPGSGLTSKLCIPIMAKSEKSMVYFGRKLDSQAIQFLVRSGRNVIEIPSVAVLNEYDKQDTQGINIYCIYNNNLYRKVGFKLNIAEYIDLIRYKYLVVIDEIGLFDFNIFELSKINELIISAHSLLYKELKSVISIFNIVYLLSQTHEENKILSQLKKVKKGKELVPYYLINELSNNPYVNSDICK